MLFIATFYSHFGAVRLKKELDAVGTAVTLKPVPRSLSSSCGTCAEFTAEVLPTVSHPDEIEQIVSVSPEGKYTAVFSTLEE